MLRRQGQRGCCPFPLHPQSPPTPPPLRCGQSRLTIPNTSSTIILPASLRSDCCSPSLRNAVRLSSGFDVRLHRNTHSSLQITRMHVCFRRKEEHLCLAKLVRSSREASVVGSSAFISGAIPKCASAPTTIKQSTALYGTHRRI